MVGCNWDRGYLDTVIDFVNGRGKIVLRDDVDAEVGMVGASSSAGGSRSGRSSMESQGVDHGKLEVILEEEV